MAHSTKSYSEDLRKRVVEARLCGRSVSEIVELYQVDDNSVYRWVAHYKKTSSHTPKKRGTGRKPKIADMAKFEAFAKVHAHSTLTQMCSKWQGEVSEMCMSRTLKRLGWTRKKSKRITANATKRSAKRSSAS
jgi:transposase